MVKLAHSIVAFARRAERLCRRLAPLLAIAILLLIFSTHATADDITDDLLQNAKPTTAPSGDIASDTQPAVDPLGTIKAKSPVESRIGTVTLSNGKKYEGQIWTTLATPFRVYIEAEKRYNDIDLALIQAVNVEVDYAQMEDDWRWLKEGSDQKVYSGKKYPNVSLRYKFTLTSGQVIEGTVVAPVYVNDGDKIHNFALYKKYKGKLDETLADVIFIKGITLRAGGAAAEKEKGLTTKLPLIED